MPYLITQLKLKMVSSSLKKKKKKALNAICMWKIKQLWPALIIQKNSVLEERGREADTLW